MWKRQDDRATKRPVHVSRKTIVLFLFCLFLFRCWSMCGYSLTWLDGALLYSFASVGRSSAGPSWCQWTFRMCMYVCLWFHISMVNDSDSSCWLTLQFFSCKILVYVQFAHVFGFTCLQNKFLFLFWKKVYMHTQRTDYFAWVQN